MSAKTKNFTHKVWSRFLGIRKDGNVVRLRIQDYPWEQHKEDILDFYMNYFIKDEIFHKTAGINNSEESRNEYREFLSSYYDVVPLHMYICCIDNDSNTNEILGISLLMDQDSDDSKFEEDSKNFQPKTKELQNLINIADVIKDIKASKGYDTYYIGRGICVRPDYRGLGIANEFVKMRKQMCIDNNIQITSSWMTSIGTEKAALKYNWKTFAELPVQEFETKSGLRFKSDLSAFKLMYTTRD